MFIINKTLQIFFILTSIVFFDLTNVNANSSNNTTEMHFSFDGFFGVIDKASARRGLQVYTEICSGCHSLKYVSYRNLSGIGFSIDQIKSFASQFEVLADPDAEGEVNMRQALPSDRFVSPYNNPNQAKAMNNGALPPDLSLIIKARAGGASYFYSLLNGYKGAPENFDASNGYYNQAYSGHVIAMPQPLYGEDVEYLDGTEATLAQEVIDLASFFTWTGQPELDERKSMGFRVFLFLVFMTGILFISYKKIWKKVKAGLV
jgi:ubiquinol-cytochrome c reductase cytochrome c1 subunit